MVNDLFRRRPLRGRSAESILRNFTGRDMCNFLSYMGLNYNTTGQISSLGVSSGAISVSNESLLNLDQDIVSYLVRKYKDKIIEYAREYGLEKLGFVGCRKREGMQIGFDLRIDGLVLREYYETACRQARGFERASLKLAISDIMDEIRCMMVENKARITDGRLPDGTYESDYLESIVIRNGLIIEIRLNEEVHLNDMPEPQENVEFRIPRQRS